MAEISSINPWLINSYSFPLSINPLCGDVEPINCPLDQEGVYGYCQGQAIHHAYAFENMFNIDFRLTLS